MLKHYAKLFFTESSFTEIEVDNKNAYLMHLPENVLFYQFFDTIEVEFRNKTILLVRMNFSPMIYLGEEFSVEKMKKEHPEEKIRIMTMELQGISRIVRTKDNDWYALREGDRVI